MPHSSAARFDQLYMCITALYVVLFSSESKQLWAT